MQTAALEMRCVDSDGTRVQDRQRHGAEHDPQPDVLNNADVGEEQRRECREEVGAAQGGSAWSRR